MSEGELELIRELLAVIRPAPGAGIAQRRERYDRAVTALGDAGAGAATPVLAGAVRAEWARRAGPAAPVLLYLHGGSYTMGSAASHRHLARAIGAEARASVLTLDYRRAPEDPFPAAVDDAVAAYQMLISECAPADRIVVAGDSAGGGLALALAQRLRASGQPLPAAIACLSPWTDLACGSATHATHASRDPVLQPDDLKAMGALYLSGAPATDPLASPAFADLSGFPPMLIQVGTEEILLDDARALARRARDAGVATEYQEWAGMFHVWQYYFPVLSEGRDAITAIGRFLATSLKAPRAPAGAPGAW